MKDKETAREPAVRDDPRRADLSELSDIQRQVAKKLAALLERRFPAGLSLTQFFVLKQLQAADAMTMSQIAERLGISLSGATALVDRLVDRRCVSRTRGEADRRVVEVSLTPLGRRLLRLAQARRDATLGRFFARLGEEDMRQLLLIYRRLLCILEEEDQNG